jgi:ATP-dependent RNA helicase RhlE
MAFKALLLNSTILQALADEGYETPTPIQAKAIPPILEGKDVLGCAQTGTGKTAAFALPMIQRLSEAPADKAHRGPKHPRALILSPTRELAAQIGESFATYGRHAGLSHTVIFGGVSQYHQSRAIHRGVDIIVATPGRLMDLMEQRIVTLKDISIFVLDEADRMLDMGFIDPIRRIASQLPRPRQTLLFSATMPREIMHLADSLLKDPVKVTVTPVASLAPLIAQQLYMVPMRQKMALLEYLLDDAAVERVLVFTKTKHGADRVCKNLNHDGVPAIAIHGNKAQNYRTRALDSFRSGKARVLVATDVAARGLDVDGITHVFNFDLPMEPEAYVHRIGRTGRAGKTGIAISFCDGNERDLLRSIQRLTGKTIPVEPLPSDLPTNDHAMAAAGRDGGYRGNERGGRGGDSRGGESRGGYGNRGDRGNARPYGQSFGQSSYRPREDARGPQNGHAPAPASPAREGRPAFAGTVNVVVTDEHRPARAGHSAPHSAKPAHSDHAPRKPHAPTSSTYPAPATNFTPPTSHSPSTPHASHAPRAPHAPRDSEMGPASGDSQAARPVNGKKMHRKGQGPATKPSRSGPTAPAAAHGGPRTGASQGSRGQSSGGHSTGSHSGHGGGHSGGSGARPNGDSRGRRGGPGGGTRGKLFSRSGPRQSR